MQQMQEGDRANPILQTADFLDGGRRRGGGHPYRLAAYRQAIKPDCWRPEAKVHW